jgi:hypothetical protein
VFLSVRESRETNVPGRDQRNRPSGPPPATNGVIRQEESVHNNERGIIAHTCGTGTLARWREPGRASAGGFSQIYTDFSFFRMVVIDQPTSDLTIIIPHFSHPSSNQSHPTQEFHQRTATGILLLHAGHPRLEGAFLLLMLRQARYSTR